MDIAKIFTDTVFKAIDVRVSQSIIDMTDTFTKEATKEMNRVISMANKRINRLRDSDVASNAFEQLQNQRENVKFSLQGKNFIQKKMEYMQAVDFLKSPTSTVLGAKQYRKYQMGRIKDTPLYKVLNNEGYTDNEIYNQVIRNATSKEFSNDFALSSDNMQNYIDSVVQLDDSQNFFDVDDSDEDSDDIWNLISILGNQK